MVRACLSLAAAALAAGCFYEFNNPGKEITVGEIRGVTLREEPGTGKLIPAVGAEILVKGSTASVKSDEKGRFRILGLPPTPEGSFYTLTIRYSTTGTKVYDLVTIKKGIKLLAGDGVNLGDIVVEKTGTISGFALRADAAESSDVHGGTFVGIPGTAFATTTFADGFYAIPLLAGGEYELAAWRAGYTLQRIQKEVAPGGSVTAAPVALPVVASSEEGVITGTVSFAGPPGPFTVRLVESGVSQQVPSGNVFSFSAPMGTYTLVVSAPGYAPMYMTNVVSDPAAEAYDVGLVTLFVAGSDADRDGIEDKDDPDDDNDGVSDSDELGCDRYPDPGKPYSCIGEPLCRPILTAGQSAVPVAIAGCDVLATPPGSEVTLDGSKSFDPAGKPLTYSWRVIAPGGKPYRIVTDLNDGFEHPVFTFRPLAATAENEFYRVELMVSNGLAYSIPATALISVNNLNAVPYFEAGTDLYAPFSFLAPAAEQALRAPPAKDPDQNGSVVAYAWVPYESWNPWSQRPAPLGLKDATAALAQPALDRRPAVGTYSWVVYAIDNQGAFSLPAFVNATFLEDEVDRSVFVDNDCSCNAGSGDGSPDRPFCTLQQALDATSVDRRDIYISTGCGTYVTDVEIPCLEGRSIYGGFSRTYVGETTDLAWSRNKGGRTSIQAKTGSVTLRCQGTQEPITSATVIDGLWISYPQNASPDRCNAVQAVLIADRASPTFSNNDVVLPSPSSSLSTLIGVNIKYASAPILFNNVIENSGTTTNAVVGVRMADGANPQLLHNMVWITSTGGGWSGGSMAMASFSQACKEGLGIADRCVNNVCTNVAAACTVDEDCALPSRPTVVNNILWVQGGLRRYGYGEFGLGSSPALFASNLIWVDATTDWALYVDGGTTDFPPSFGGAQLIRNIEELNMLPEAREEKSNQVAEPVLSSHSCSYCPAFNSPTVNAGRSLFGIPGLSLDGQGNPRPDPSGKPDIGPNEFYPSVQ